jgi:small subunit ribosomal protein S3Ae
MAKKGKTAARKVKDKWKAKEWYKVYAPAMFNQVMLGETPGAEPSMLVGRTAEATVHDLTGDFSKMHLKIKFQINDIRGYDAYTVFMGHDLTSDYVRRLTRRKRSKTDHTIDVRTKDGYMVRVKPMSIADRRIQSSQESALRMIMEEEVSKTVSEMTISDLVRNIISGDLAKDIARSCKTIVPIRRIEIMKTQVLEMGEPLPILEKTDEGESEEEMEQSEEVEQSEEEVMEEVTEESEEGSEEESATEESEVTEEETEVIEEEIPEEAVDDEVPEASEVSEEEEDREE